jgi:Tol biopolymer transport system component
VKPSIALALIFLRIINLSLYVAYQCALLERYNLMKSLSLLSALSIERNAVMRSLMLVAQGIVIICTSSLFLAPPQTNYYSAFGTLAGPNEQIVFFSERDGNQEIYVMNAADGSNQTRLTSINASDSDASWSPDRTKIAFESDREGNSNIYVMNADGSGLIQLTDNLANYSNPKWSPDGAKIAFNTDRHSAEAGFNNQEIYVMNAADGSNQTRLTINPARDSLPSWSPDGTKIAFYSERDVDGNIYVMNAADGSNQTKLTISPRFDSFPSWSPDGTKIAFDSNRDGNEEIYVMNAADGSNQTRLTYNDVLDTGPSWSPDGTKIAFASAKDGNAEIYVMNAADGSGQTRLTNNTAADAEPDW